jgi:hypothetical protein
LRASPGGVNSRCSVVLRVVRACLRADASRALARCCPVPATSRPNCACLLRGLAERPLYAGARLLFRMGLSLTLCRFWQGAPPRHSVHNLRGAAQRDRRYGRGRQRTHSPLRFLSSHCVCTGCACLRSCCWGCSDFAVPCAGVPVILLLSRCIGLRERHTRVS